MLQFNGDLVDRIAEIPVEPWTDPYLFMVAREGEKHLNVEFATAFLQKCVNASFGSVGVFQEIMRGVCEAAHILETQKDKRRIAEDVFLTESLKTRAEAYEHRHRQSLLSLSAPDQPQAADDISVALEWICLARLSEKTRDIFLSDRVDGMSYQQIAQCHNLSVSTVEKHIARATLQVTGWMEGW